VVPLFWSRAVDPNEPCGCIVTTRDVPEPSASALKDLQLKVARAWAAKELFSKFWNYQEEGWARRFFKDWFGWVSSSRLKPMVEVAQMLKRHLDNLLTYLDHHITNAVTEGLNSKIQSLKSAARGFRNFRNYRIRILFFCGKLNLYPQ
jgi:transposase